MESLFFSKQQNLCLLWNFKIKERNEVELPPSIDLYFFKERNCVIVTFVFLMSITVPGIEHSMERHLTFIVISHHQLTKLKDNKGRGWKGTLEFAKWQNKIILGFFLESSSYSTPCKPLLGFGIIRTNSLSVFEIEKVWPTHEHGFRLCHAKYIPG